MYAQGARPQVVQDYPELAPKDVMKKLGEQWKTFSTTEKESLRQDYAKELEEYTKQIMVYEQNLTVEQKRSIKAEKYRALEANEKTKMKAVRTILLDFFFQI